MIDKDMVKALRCLASHDIEGDCYMDYYNIGHPDEEMTCIGTLTKKKCPYHQDKYPVCYEEGECGGWLSELADDLERAIATAHINGRKKRA